MAYGLATPLIIGFLDLPEIAWIIFASTLVLLYGAAVGFDAVYESLSERKPE
jgi:hypothetical protein